jgi:carbon-monoxide dehydrogenase medium subunit
VNQLKCSSFKYVKAKTVEGAISLLVEHGDMAVIIAGGQSLIPALNLRLSSPETLIDIGGIKGLSEIIVQDDFVRIGALVLHAEIYRSEIIAEYIPLLSKAVRYVAHDAIRNRGTFGGSLSNAHPASEFPACVVALGGTVNLQGPSGFRSVSSDDFFTGLFSTAMEPDEILLSVDLPVLSNGQQFVFSEYAPRHGDYAVVGLAATATLENGVFSYLRLVYFGVEDRPIRALNAEACLTGKKFDESSLKLAILKLENELNPSSDFGASAEYRLQLAKVMLKRVITELVEQGA